MASSTPTYEPHVQLFLMQIDPGHSPFQALYLFKLNIITRKQNFSTIQVSQRSLSRVLISHFFHKRKNKMGLKKCCVHREWQLTSLRDLSWRLYWMSEHDNWIAKSNEQWASKMSKRANNVVLSEWIKKHIGQIGSDFFHYFFLDQM